MQKTLHRENIKSAIQTLGWTQKDLAEHLGVTGQAVTNWMKGTDFPRPDKLLKLATTLKLGFAQLVQLPEGSQPIVAFRKKAGTKTTDEHVTKAMAMGALLKALVPYLPPTPQLRRQLPDPSTDYTALHNLVSQVRKALGVGDTDAVDYAQQLLGEFADNGAVVIPVMWCAVQNHKNALHILLPRERITFIFLNLDTHLEDFKFWMAHELAHVYTPQLAGRDEGEDFADAFAAALLFPQQLAQTVYSQVAGQSTALEAKVLHHFAYEHSISLNTVFMQVNRFALANQLPPLHHTATAIHKMRNAQRGQLVSETLFAPPARPPSPGAYVAMAEQHFHSPFFQALRRMVRHQQTGAGYLQQVLDIPLQDALALHGELSR